MRYQDAEEKARVYLETEPLFAQGRIEILDHPQLIRELKTLERRPRAGGRTLVDHPQGGHDDHANALALAVAQAAQHAGCPYCSCPACAAGECGGFHFYGDGHWEEPEAEEGPRKTEVERVVERGGYWWPPSGR